MPRLFTAIEIPAETARGLAEMRGGIFGARWVEPANYHVTLRFIGDVDVRTADDIVEQLDDIRRKPDRSGEDPRALDEQGGGLTGGRFDIAGYLDLQGRRFVDRFDANAYLAILRTMDTWDPLHGHASPKTAFSPIRASR